MTTLVLSDRWLRRALDALEAGTRDLTPPQLAFRPTGAWSAAEVVDHLAIAYNNSAVKLQKAAAAERLPVNKRTLKHLLFTAVVIGLGLMPGDPQAPESARPKGVPTDEALRQARAGLATLDELLTVCTQRHGAHVGIADHSSLGPLTAPQWARFHWIHTREHLKQIKRLRAASIS
jgi:hypothetical protein